VSILSQVSLPADRPSTFQNVYDGATIRYVDIAVASAYSPHMERSMRMMNRRACRIVDISRERARRRGHGAGDPAPSIRLLARYLGGSIAHAARADSWTMTVRWADAELTESRLRNPPGGRGASGAAARGATVALVVGAREIGRVYLRTGRPGGFSGAEIVRAHAAGECAARFLALAIDLAAQDAAHAVNRGAHSDPARCRSLRRPQRPLPDVPQIRAAHGWFDP